MKDYINIPYLEYFNKKNIEIDIYNYLTTENSKIKSLLKDGNSSISMYLDLFLSSYCLDIKEKEFKYLLEEQLVSNYSCMAYSKKYSEQLYKFNNQYIQHDIYTEYSHWIISNYFNDDITQQKEKIINNFIKENDFIYNENNSDTIENYRMKNELLMQTAMAYAIIDNNKDTIIFNKSIGEPEYISTEYFRYKISEITNTNYPYSQEQIKKLLKNCKADTGLCDFNSESKKDEYMGTQTRTERDKKIFSPIATLQGVYLADKLNLPIQSQAFRNEVKAWYNKNGIEIPSFKMRDIDIPFGPGKTITEVIALGILISK